MMYQLKYARVIKIVYTETHEQQGWLPAGCDSTTFDDYNKNVLDKILADDADFDIELDGNFLTTITLDNDNNQLAQTGANGLVDRRNPKIKGLDWR